MYKQILVPLDGSERAERAVPVAARIARATGGTVVLLQVANLIFEYGPYLGQGPVITTDVVEQELESAKIYLTTVAGSAALEGVKTEIETMPGMEAQTILTYAQLRKADIIVMCSHGRSGFKRWALGSVAQKIVRHSSIPVLVLRKDTPKPEELLTGSLQPLHTLVGLDGSPLAEAVLIPAAHLTAALSIPTQGELHLVQVIKSPIAQPGLKLEEADAIKERAIRDASTYLSNIAAKFSQGLGTELGLNITWSVAVGEDIANELIKRAELGNDSKACDMIAVATHGRGGVERWMLGSIAERILTDAKLPLLVIRPQQLRMLGSEVAGERVVVRSV